MTEKLPSKYGFAFFLKKGLQFFAVVVFLFSVVYGTLAYYLYTHKNEVLAEVTQSLNNSISGALSVQSMETTLIQDFPRISVRLKNVTLRDSLYHLHKTTFLKAGVVGVSVNTLALLRGTVQISSIYISDAAINLFTAKQGYTNTSIFKKKASSGASGEDDNATPELKRLVFKNVMFQAVNRKSNKLYKFGVNKLNADLKYNGDNINASLSLNGFAHSMAFNTQKGSFIKDKTLKGKFSIRYNTVSQVAHFSKNTLAIGGNPFVIGAQLQFNETGKFAITIENESILWKEASGVLSPNISKKLNMFNLDKPIRVACDLVGSFNDEGDPLIQVNAWVKNNKLSLPEGTIKQCNFFGVFTNNRQQGSGYNDANSAIKLFQFTGAYRKIAFDVPRIEIRNLEKPVAVGSLKATFNIKDLDELAGPDVIQPTKGTASASLKFKADVERFQLVKPLVEGRVNIHNANLVYLPRRLSFTDINVQLHFNKDNLMIDKVGLKTGKSVFKMNGSVQNFLNLYYTAPEKMVLDWNVYSPDLYLNEFMAFLQNRKAAVKQNINTKSNYKENNPVSALGSLFENGSVHMAMKADNVHYKRFLATNAHAHVYLTETGNIIVKNAGFNHAGGTLNVNGAVSSAGATNYNLNAKVENTDVSKFLYAFDNFGMESLSSKNLKGQLSAVADVNGVIGSNGTLLPNSINGGITFTLKKGKLIDFDPIVNVGKFAFPFRDVKNISFKDLNGRFDVKGSKVQVSPLEISSSVLNMDIEGVYSFGKGTLLYIDVPLRNPEKDKGITDKAELRKRRQRGVVVHLIAEDDDKGKVKIKLGKKRD